MAGKVFALEQLEVIVGQSDQIKNWLAVEPVKPSWMNVSMDQSMVMHMSNCACDLAEQKEKTRCGEVGLAELLPETNVLRAFHFKQE